MLRHRQHRQPRRAGASRCSASSTPSTPACGRCWPASPTGSHALGADELAARQRRRPRAHRSAAAPRRAGRPPDERGRGGPLRRAGHDRLAGVGPPARRRHVAAVDRRARSPTGATERLPMAAVRGLATHADPAVRRAAYDAELAAWPQVAVAVRGGDERDQGRGQHRQPPPPLGVAARRVAVRQRRQPADVRRHAVGGRRRARPTSAAGCGPRPRSTATTAPLPWWDLVAPLPVAPVGDLAGTRASSIVRDGVRRVQRPPRRARRPRPRRALDRRRAARRQARRRVLHVVRRRPLARAAQLDGQRRLGPDHRPRARPRLPQHHAGRPHAAAAAAADGAGRDGQHLLRDARRRGGPAASSTGADRLALLDVDLQGATQVVVDIHSRFLFETEVFARRQRRTLGVAELDELMLAGPGRRLRRRARPVDGPPVHVGRQAALLRRPLLQLAVHVRPAVRARPVRPLPRRPRPVPRRATTTCSRGPAWTRPRSSARRSASTSPTRRSGRPASTCCGAASTSTSGSPPSCRLVPS